ncbi:MAG: hypothetical protein JNM84_20180 [Planctomycetes bacterium]|nr:hypothetical protein [Planctomycetota bacterium]
MISRLSSFLAALRLVGGFRTRVRSRRLARKTELSRSICPFCVNQTTSAPSSAVRGTGSVSADPWVLFVAAGGAPAVEPGVTRLTTELPALRAELRCDLQLVEIELRGPGPARFALFAAGVLDAMGPVAAAPAVPGDPALVGVRAGFQAVRAPRRRFSVAARTNSAALRRPRPSRGTRGAARGASVPSGQAGGVMRRR